MWHSPLAARQAPSGVLVEKEVGVHVLVERLQFGLVVQGVTVPGAGAGAEVRAVDAETRAAHDARRHSQAGELWRARGISIDELGYLTYTNRYADLLFEVITQRYMKAPIVTTTNRPFSEWAAVFKSATCVGTLLDRLRHGSVEDIGDDPGEMPPPATDVGVAVQMVATTGLHTCALTVDGDVRCWGRNEHG